MSDDEIHAWLHGGLTDEEAEQVEAAIASNKRVAERARELRRLDALCRQAIPLEDPLPAGLMARLGLASAAADDSNVIELASAHIARIEAAPADSARFAALTSGGWRIAAQMLIVIGIGLTAAQWLGVPEPKQPEARYRALGDAPSAGSSANVLAMFASGTDVAEVKEIVDRAGARIVGVRNEAGAWRLAVDPARRDAVLNQLRARPEVVLAEPIDSARQ